MSNSLKNINFAFLNLFINIIILKKLFNRFKKFENKKNQHLIVKNEYIKWCLNNLKWNGDFKITSFLLHLTNV